MSDEKTPMNELTFCVRYISENTIDEILVFINEDPDGESYEQLDGSEAARLATAFAARGEALLNLSQAKETNLSDLVSELMHEIHGQDICGDEEVALFALLEFARSMIPENAKCKHNNLCGPMENPYVTIDGTIEFNNECGCTWEDCWYESL